MSIANRELNATEQMRSLASVISTSVAASAGQSFHVAQAPYAGTLAGLAIAANSVSGAPVVSLDIKRWSGAGVTTISNVGQSLVVTAHGISLAFQSMSLVASGSTLLSIQAGDVFVLNQNFTGGNVAVGNAVVTVVMQAVSDFKTSFSLPSSY